MTQKQSNFIKDNFINFSTLVIVIGFIWNQGKFNEKVNNHIDKDYKELKESTSNHNIDKDKHMPYSDKIKEFVRNVDYVQDIVQIKDMIKEQNDVIKEQNKLLIELIKKTRN